MRILSLFLTLFAITPAWSHPGHLAEVAGHNHWIAIAALGAAVAIGLLAGKRGKSTKAEPAEEEAEEQDAEA